MSTLYKIYATVLAERLREEVEGKGIFSRNQTGFKKGMGTIDNIHIKYANKQKFKYANKQK